MMLPELRERHPRFIYDSFQTEQRNEELHVRFHFLLEPDVVFTPEIVLPQNHSLDQQELENFAFHMGLIEMISYWKTACPQEIKIEAGQLTEEQVSWWHDLFIHGLGEFFYQNSIDFTPPDFFRITSDQSKEPNVPVQKPLTLSGDLILLGGGKDSTVTLELLKDSPVRKKPLILNPIRPAIESAKIAGYSDPLIVKRRMDSKLLELNQKGYLNGHTPFSAYLAFLGVFIGTLHRYQNIIVSNDRSAEEENILFHGQRINHQYSRSFHFEKLFREYCAKYLNPQVQYFSFLRPLYEIQISQLFAKYPEHHLSFRSCNVGQKEDVWCGACAKCAFVYVSLFPFLSFERAKEIFGEDYYFKSEIVPFIRELVGLEGHKPFECVGTREESILAIALAIRKYKSAGKQIPPLLLSLERKLGLDDAKTVQLLEEEIQKGWNYQHFLPEEYVKLLKESLGKI